MNEPYTLRVVRSILGTQVISARLPHQRRIKDFEQLAQKLNLTPTRVLFGVKARGPYIRVTGWVDESQEWTFIYEKVDNHLRLFAADHEGQTFKPGALPWDVLTFAAPDVYDNLSNRILPSFWDYTLNETEESLDAAIAKTWPAGEVEKVGPLTYRVLHVKNRIPVWEEPNAKTI
jgi:hypothetical protein